MPAPEGERLATLEAELRGVREDMVELTAETRRSRKRIHDLEGVASALVSVQKDRQIQENSRQRRTELRLQAMATVLAVGLLVEPFLYHFATGG